MQESRRDGSPAFRFRKITENFASDKENDMKKRNIAFAVMAAFLLTGCANEVVTVAGTISEEDQEAAAYIEMKEFELKEEKKESGREEVRCCAVLIPAGYVESEEIPGMYVHERNPLDSSNIYYTASEGDADGMVSDKLTKTSYEKIMEEAYKESGHEIDLTVTSFEEIDMEGVPGYKIRSVYEVEGGEIEQLAYLIVAENTYTVTYSQMADDDLMADFEISDGEIKLVREGEVSLASAGE